MFLSYFIVKLRYEIWHKLKVGTYMINEFAIIFVGNTYAFWQEMNWTNLINSSKVYKFHEFCNQKCMIIDACAMYILCTIHIFRLHFYIHFYKLS